MVWVKMGKLILFLFVGIFMFGVVSGATAISNCQELQNMKNDWNKDYYLTNDIDCTGFVFTPVGFLEGTLDGRYYVVRNLYINKNQPYVGLIGYLTGTIRNLGLEDIDFQAWDDYSGGLVGQSSYGEIYNSYTTGTIRVRYYKGYIGGLVGQNFHGKIRNSYSRVDISFDDDGFNTGGLVGTNWEWDGGDIANSYAASSVERINDFSIGGFAGVTAHESVPPICESSYWDTSLSCCSGGFPLECGAGRTTAQMKQPATFVGWDFENVWAIDPLINDGYPYLITPACIPDGCNNNCPIGCDSIDDLDCGSTGCCGDDLVDIPLEECDLGEANTDTCNADYGSFCNYCSNFCINETVIGGFCGDEILEGSESCDNGAMNGDICDPTGLGSCTYCDSSCVEHTVEEQILFWTDMDGVPIVEANVGQRVKMVQLYSGSGSFEIKEQDGDRGGDNDEDLRVDANAIVGVEDSDGNLIGVWKITRADYEVADDGSESEDGHIEAYFIVNGDDSVVGLNISKDYTDEPMEITFESPICGEDFVLDITSEIKVSASDPDDLITGNVSVDGIKVMDFSNGGNSTSYKWDTSGNIQVELFAINDRGYMRRMITSVMVVEEGVERDYVAACIDKPADFSDITSSTVEFDARSSAGLRCGAEDSTIGECDSIDYKGLWFSWEFSDETFNFHHDGSVDILAYEFNKTFVTLGVEGHSWAILDVEMM